VSRAPARQHSINLLLPLMLLNLTRKRSDDERALAIARINSLLGRRRVGI
jgi:type III secretion regulatory protein HpaA